MVSQIFKTPFPKEKLFKFLDQCVEKKHNAYLFTKVSFKVAQYKELIDPFCKEIENYYFNSKKYYASRKMTYKHIVTIIRQICKFHFIPFTSHIDYSKSRYEISYTVFIAPVL